MISRTVNRVVADFRATALARRSIKEEAKASGLRLALSMLDLTTLEGKDSPGRIRSLCRKAAQPAPGRTDLPAVAAVCVYPPFVRLARECLAGTPVRVASVATSFPSGQAPMEVRLAEVRRVVADGAQEVDMVLNRGALLSGDEETVHREIRQVKAACRRARLKVILETGELESYDRVRQASELALAAGADFIKTSTGKVRPAATPGVTLVMLEAVRDHYLKTGRRAGVKPAGGIRTAKQALHYLVLVKETLGDDWLDPEYFRFGASSLANDLLMQIVKGLTGNYPAAYDFSIA